MEEIQWVKMNPMDWLDSLSSRVSTPVKATSLVTSCTIPSPTKELESLPTEIEESIAKIECFAVPSLWHFESFPKSQTLDRVRVLVVYVECHANFEDAKSRLEDIRDHFTFSFARLKSLSDDQTMSGFEELCREAVRRLQYLATTMSGIPLPLEECSSHAITTTPDTTHSVATTMQHSPARSTDRTAFHAHMNNWLRANWINPYPDEAVSHQLAYETGEDVNVVNTWLVNARSRRWRPAVLKAYELGRPSEYLLEDSINIFEDQPLRPIKENDPVFTSESNKRARHH